MHKNNDFSQKSPLLQPEVENELSKMVIITLMPYELDLLSYSTGKQCKFSPSIFYLGQFLKTTPPSPKKSLKFMR
jgi:hypothetical protein